MPVTNVWPEAAHSARLSGEAGTASLSIVERYGATTTGPVERAVIELLTDTRLPQYRQRHSVANLLQVVLVDPREDQNVDGLWKIDVEYSTVSNERDDPNPLARPAEITMETVEEEEPRYYDVNGNALVNTAGDLLVGITEIVERQVWSVKKNVPRVPRWLRRYGGDKNSGGAVNSDTVRFEGESFPPGVLRFRRARRGPRQVEYITAEQAVAYFELTFELHERFGGWKRQFANVGFQERFVLAASAIEGDPDPYRKRRILDNNGEPIAEPAWLDADGLAVRNPDDDSELKTVLDREDIVVLEYDMNRKLPFSVLPLK